MGPDVGELLSGPHRVREEPGREGDVCEPALDAGNVDKTMAAPATAIVAYDLEFYARMPLLAPRTDVHRRYSSTSLT